MPHRSDETARAHRLSTFPLAHDQQVQGKSRRRDSSEVLIESQEECIPLLNAIIYQIFARVYLHLESTPQGTDEAFQHSELRRAYFNIIMAVFNANMQGIFLTESQ